MLNCFVNARIFFWMQIVDVASKLCRPVVAECHIGGQPLVQARAILFRNRIFYPPPIVVEKSFTIIWHGLDFRYSSALADEREGSFDANLLLIKEFGPAFFIFNPLGVIVVKRDDNRHIPNTKGYMDGCTRFCTISLLRGCQSTFAAWSVRRVSNALTSSCRRRSLIKLSDLMMVLPAESRVGIRPVSIKYLALLRNSAIHCKVDAGLLVSLSSCYKGEMWCHSTNKLKGFFREDPALGKGMFI